MPETSLIDKQKPILIASSSIDTQSYSAVANILAGRGYEVVVYDTDKVVRGIDILQICMSNDSELSVGYNQTDISPGSIGSAWYRKVNHFKVDRTEEDVARQLHVSNEVQQLHSSIWQYYPDDLWLNSPRHIVTADSKLVQLRAAKEVGFSIPQTVISNDWDYIVSDLMVTNPTIIVKMIRGVISRQNHLKGMYATPLDMERVAPLKESTIPFPGIYQPFVKKGREWRVTVVGDNIFPVSIYTDESAKDDWRKHQLNPSVQFKSEQLPPTVGEKCPRCLSAIGLKYGAFDLIETPEEEVVFLECNPDGQYGWLEDRLNLPISDAIAIELAKIATSEF
jgi:glutathione synthase/RimK-type ligase-like ATP-grasp enzyme